MNRKLVWTTMAVLMGPAVAVGAQPPLPQGPAPLLYAQFQGPAGSRLAVYTGGPVGSDFALPATVGFRPGYLYRVKISGLPEMRGQAIYPTLEVRGSLHLPPQLRAQNYPVPISFSPEDLERVANGTYLTKVIYLENPAKAQAVATRPDQPLETDVRPDQDPVAEARLLGRPMVIVRLGSRTIPEMDLMRQSIPGTVLLPSDKALGPPAAPPCIPWACQPLYDPKLGPRCLDEECFHDGGDQGLPVGLDAEGRLLGVDPSDTAAAYNDSKGARRVAISNQVCLCVPRYAVIRSRTIPTGMDTALTLSKTQLVLAQSLFRRPVRPLLTAQTEQLLAMRSRERASATVASTGVAVLDQLRAPAIVIGQNKERTIVGTLIEQPTAPDRPLVLCKSVDRQDVQIGDVVTFTLTFSNRGGQPITGVALSDSLTGRLEYVEGSAKASREAVFTMQENDAGSLLLHWEIPGVLQPGQSGTVSFQARIR